MLGIAELRVRCDQSFLDNFVDQNVLVESLSIVGNLYDNIAGLMVGPELDDSRFRVYRRQDAYRPIRHRDRRHCDVCMSGRKFLDHIFVQFGLSPSIWKSIFLLILLTGLEQLSHFMEGLCQRNHARHGPLLNVSRDFGNLLDQPEQLGRLLIAGFCST